jgi:hypothetical protein
MTTSSEIDVAFGRAAPAPPCHQGLRRTIGSSASERAFHASQSLFTLRQSRPDDVLAHRAAKQRCERAAHPAGVGAGQISARDQRVGSNGPALIGARRLALFHSVVLPSAVASRARGNAISVLPKVPVSVRARLPCRWPATPEISSPATSFARLNAVLG